MRSFNTAISPWIRGRLPFAARPQGKASGRFNNLFYLRRIRPDYTLVAMMDITVAESGLTSLLRNFLAVGGGAIGVMFFLAVRLSRQIIRPLEENDRKQKQFVSDASHELKTPVAVIGANAEMLSRQIGENEWLTNILYENEHMGGLVKHLLELSRAENPQMQKEPLDFSRMVTGEVLAFESMAFDRGKVVNSQVEDSIHLLGSRIQLTQIISVLLDNAVEHATGAQIEAEESNRHPHCG